MTALTKRVGRVRCVCGHLRSAHRAVVLSVKLTAIREKPLYPIVGLPWIAAPAPNATYDGVECHCGCTIFEVDR